MGANARRRASLKVVARRKKPASVRPSGATKTQVRLRARMAEVATLQQFEEIVAQAHKDDRGAIRKLLEPMLRPDLPCCGPCQLAEKLVSQGKTVEFEHTSRCPTRKRVLLDPHGRPVSSEMLQ